MKAHVLRACLGLLTATTLFSPTAAAHPISTGWARVEVGVRTLTIDWELLADELVWVHSLTAGADDRVDANTLARAASAHREYLLDRLEVQVDSGSPLSGRIVATSFPDWPAQGVTHVELQRQSLHYRLEFDLPAPPAWLTFFAAGARNATELPLWLEVVIEQEGKSLGAPHVLTHDLPLVVLIPHGSATATPSSLLAPNRTRSTVAVAPDAVTQSIDVPLGLLAEAIGVDLRDARPLDATEADRFLDRSWELIRHRIRLRNAAACLVVTRVSRQIIGPEEPHEFEHTAVANARAPRVVASALSRRDLRARFILDYAPAPRNQPPGTIEFEWTLWNASLEVVESTIHRASPTAATDTRMLRPSQPCHAALATVRAPAAREAF
ncbi:MAG: hypothetical protein AB7O52_18275 [Planctomycetota bacterium]